MDALTDGLKAIEAVSIKELDERIDWLEEQLRIYKTLRIMRELVDKRPADLRPPWTSAVDMDRQDKAPVATPTPPATASAYRSGLGDLKPRDLWELVLPVMDTAEAYEHGLTTKEIARALRVPSTMISKLLANVNYRVRLERISSHLGSGRWRLKGPRVLSA